MEEVLIRRRRQKLEEELAQDEYNYDLWFDYIKLEEQAPNTTVEVVRDVYERAIACQPLVIDKKHWSRYIYLWLYYAVYEEEVAQDIDRARAVYEQAIKIVPHESFTFSKLWISYASYLIRRMDILGTRKLLGRALGMCPKKKQFKFYIDLEMQLGEIERCRKIFERQIQVFSFQTEVWTQYAQFEAQLGEVERARAIFELAVC